MNRYCVLFVCACVLFCCGLPTIGQTKPKKAPTAGRNLITVTFSQKWTFMLDEPAKLIDIGPVTDPKKNNLVALQGSNDPKDNTRKLIIMHWDGMHFAKDSSMDFRGLAVDSLLIGKFRSARNTPVQRSPFDRTLPGSRPVVGGGGAPVMIYAAAAIDCKWKTADTVAAHSQVVTTEGIYAWMNKGMSRLFGAPIDVRLALVMDDEDQDDRLVTGSGDTAAEYEIGENYVRESTDGAPTSGGGFVRFGSGTQDFFGAAKMTLAPDVRYVQSVWEGKSKWMLGVVQGTQAKTPDNPTSTTGDRLVVYVPKFASRAKSFWQMKMDDFEEDWRSGPLPGRLLDVRVGDPKNDGKTGILVLTSESKDSEGHLYFFTQDK